MTTPGTDSLSGEIFGVILQENVLRMRWTQKISCCTLVLFVKIPILPWE